MVQSQTVEQERAARRLKCSTPFAVDRNSSSQRKATATVSKLVKHQSRYRFLLWQRFDL